MAKRIYFSLLFLLTSCHENSIPHETKDISECLADILWQELNKNTLDYDLETVIDTLKKNAAGRRTPLEKPRTTLSQYIEKSNEKQFAQALEKAENFLLKLSEQTDHNILIPGKLIYKTITHGDDGPSIQVSHSPLMRITEKDLDGEILLDTAKEPIRLPLAETVMGFKLGVMGMQIGERREIIVHPDLAYKKLGKTKSNQLLIYDVTILEE